MRYPWLVLATIALSACDGVAVYGPVQTKSALPQSLLALAAEKGAIVAEVRGNPFSIPDARLSELVRGYMRGSHFGPAARFDAAPSEATVEPYKVVVVFNPAPEADHDKLCQGATKLSDRGGADKMTVAMAFCFGSDRISGTWGTVRGVTGPDDTRFRALIERTTATLVPIYRRETDSR